MYGEVDENGQEWERENGKAKMEEKQIQSGGWWLGWQAMGVGGGEGENEAKVWQQKGKQKKRGKIRKKVLKGIKNGKVAV